MFRNMATTISILVLALFSLNCVNDPDVSEGISIGQMVQNATPKSITLTWETLSDSDTAVEYGTTSDYGNVATGTTTMYYIADMGTTQKAYVYHHEITIDGLSPNTQYHYSIASLNEPTEDETFWTAPDPGSDTDFTFIVYGDNREALPSVPSNPQPQQDHENLVKMMISYNPRFVLHTGDMVMSGIYEHQWQVFIDTASPLMKSIPYYPIIGNHDYYETSDEVMEIYYLRYFALPSESSGSNSERYYSMDYGPVHFVSIDQYKGFVTTSDEQYQWLSQDLQSAYEDPNTKFIILGFHEPIWTTSSHSPDSTLRELLKPLISQYEICASVAGHNHIYEHLTPDVDGFTGHHHIVLGAGGAPMVEYAVKGEGDAEQESLNARINYNDDDHSFGLFEVSGDTLTANIILEDGIIYDQFIVSGN